MNSLTLTSPLPADQNAAAVYIQSLGGIHSTGGRTQAQALRAIAQVLELDLIQIDWGALRYQHTAMIRAKIASRYSPATSNKVLSALRQTLRRAWLLGQMSAEDYNKAIDLKPVTGDTILAGRELTEDEIKALMDTCKADKDRKRGIRDAAMIALMFLLRREEVAKLTISNYSPETGKIVVVGKRRKQRTIYVTNGTRDALHDWLLIRGSEPGAMFTSINKSGKLNPRFQRLTAEAVYQVVTKRSMEAGIENNSPHNFRRTAISNLLDSPDTDIATIAKLFGHEKVETTKKYDRRGDRAIQKAASLLHIPY